MGTGNQHGEKRTARNTRRARRSDYDWLAREVSALYSILCDVYGTDQVVLKASKLDALDLIRSNVLAERVLAMKKLVSEDPTIDRLPLLEEIPQILEEIQEEIADFMARRSVEDRLERRIAEKMQERHEEYVQELKLQVLKESAGPENAQTLKKLALLEKMERVKLAQTAMEILRPKKIGDIVGQERALKALISKIASPFPQHVILYGPPGVGKTTAARLALDIARRMRGSAFGPHAPFVEVNGATLRWDPREVTNPLLGSVHDPIYQGARRDLAENGVPEPKLGLVTEAHGGILFIDEIGEMDPILLTKLLKVLEDKRVEFDSSYYDPSNENIPKYIKKIFEEGAPADFILIGATTRDPAETNPALRSRCAEVFFDPLTPGDIQEIIRKSAVKLKAELEDGVPEIISEYTVEGRKANAILADAYSLALLRQRGEKGSGKRKVVVTADDVYEVVRSSRLSPYVTQKASSEAETGRIFGLGVSGFVGSVIEFEAMAFAAREPGRGKLRFNETAGSMARDSVFNAASVFRKLTGLELSDYDVHVNVVGGGNIDGPSAGLAIVLAILSAVKDWPIRQDVAVTGEISIRGKVRPVGGIYEKIYGAKQAGIKTVVIPAGNLKDVPSGLRGIKVVPVGKVEDAFEHIFIPAPDTTR